MTKLSLIAAAMWREEAMRSGTNGIAARRTVDAFEQESDETRAKWLGLARVALAAIEEEQD